MKFFLYVVGALVGAVFSPIVLYFFSNGIFYSAPSIWTRWVSLYQNEFLFPSHGESPFANPNLYVGALLGALNVQWLTRRHRLRQAWLNTLVGAVIGGYYLWNIAIVFHNAPIYTHADSSYEWSHNVLMLSLLLYSPLVVGTIALLVLGILNWGNSEQNDSIRPYAVLLLSTLVGAVFLQFFMWGSAQIFVVLVPMRLFHSAFSTSYIGSPTAFAPYLISLQDVGIGAILGFATALLGSRKNPLISRPLCVLVGLGVTSYVYSLLQGLCHSSIRILLYNQCCVFQSLKSAKLRQTFPVQFMQRLRAAAA